MSQIAEYGARVSVRRLASTEVHADVVSAISELTSQLSGRTIALSIEDVRTIATENYFEVAEDGPSRNIVGIACLVIMRLPQGTRFLIETVVVDERARGKGIGEKLIEGLLIEAARHDASGHVSLTCNDKRPGALRFYCDLGFKKATTNVLRRPVMRKLN